MTADIVQSRVQSTRDQLLTFLRQQLTMVQGMITEDSVSLQLPSLVESAFWLRVQYMTLVDVRSSVQFKNMAVL